MTAPDGGAVVAWLACGGVFGELVLTVLQPQRWWVRALLRVACLPAWPVVLGYFLWQALLWGER